MGFRQYLPGGRRPLFISGGNIWVLDMDDTYRAVAADNTVHDITTEDIGIFAWVKIPVGAGIGVILAKRIAAAGYFLYSAANGKVVFAMSDGADTYSMTGTTDLRDDTWHCIVNIIDRSNAANCSLYIDGVDDSPVKAGTLADVNSLTNAVTFYMGSSSSPALEFDGIIAECGIAYPADIMAANEMGASGEIDNIVNNFRTSAAYPNLEDYWACDEGSGTTLAGNVNDLTLSNAAAWTEDTAPG